MTDHRYNVRITHKDKGVGFTVRDALRNSQKQPHSPIRQARFSGEPSGSETIIEVTVDDTPTREFIRKSIENSGRVPSIPGIYSIESIELLEDGAQREGKRVKELERELGTAQRETARLRDESSKLRQEATHNVKLESPVHGLLAYFDTRRYSPNTMFSDPAEIGFARSVVCEHRENTFEEYASHILGRRIAKEEIEVALTYNPEKPDDMKALRSKYETARAETEFLSTLKEEISGIPASLREDYIRVIEQKNHAETINVYESKVKERQETEKLRGTLEELKTKYTAFSEGFSLLSQAGDEVEVIFAPRKGGELDVYFPFVARNVKAGFIDDLKKELHTYFGSNGTDVKPLENRFVAYTISGGKEISDKVGHMVEDVPFTLRIAGFNKLIPYRLG